MEIHLAPISADLASTFDWFLLIGTSSESYKQCKANEPKKHSASADNAAPEAFDPFVFFKCESIFGHENSPFLTGIATIVVGIFTVTLWFSHRDHAKLTREIERAYLSGGGPVDRRKTPHQFVLTVQNYGKTPGYLTDFAVEVDTVAHVQANDPAYCAEGYQRHHFEDTISPHDRVKSIWSVAITVANPVAYGRFWYKDIWEKEHHFSFILPLDHGNDHGVVRDVSPKYTEWT